MNSVKISPKTDPGNEGHLLKKETGNTVAGIQGLHPRSMQIAGVVHSQTAAGIEAAVVGSRPGAFGLEQGAESPEEPLCQFLHYQFNRALVFSKGVLKSLLVRK